MKLNRRTLLAISFISIAVALAPSSSWAATNLFVGDWKLDPSRSKLTDVMKVQMLSSNKYTFDFGVGSPETIVIDGTDQPGMAGTTLSVSVEQTNAWKVVRKKDGRMLLTANWRLSKDGNTLTDNFSEMATDGSASTVDYVYRRKGEGSGFAGRWVSTSEVVNFSYVLQIRPYDRDGLSVADTSSQLVRTMKQDGKDYPNTGSNAGIVVSSSLRRVDEYTLELTDKSSSDRLYDTQHYALSSDRNTLTVTILAVGRDEPNILVFLRQ